MMFRNWLAGGAEHWTQALCADANKSSMFTRVATISLVATSSLAPKHGGIGKKVWESDGCKRGQAAPRTLQTGANHSHQLRVGMRFLEKSDGARLQAAFFIVS